MPHIKHTLKTNSLKKIHIDQIYSTFFLQAIYILYISHVTRAAKFSSDDLGHPFKINGDLVFKIQNLNIFKRLF